MTGGGLQAARQERIGEFVRFRNARPNLDGFHVGIFGLVNVLGRHGMLTPDEERFRQENNAWYDAAYPTPPIYDKSIHPHAAAWFRTSASNLLAKVPGYLAILDAHNIAWEQLRSADPGQIIYADEVQAIAIPNKETTRDGQRLLSARPASVPPSPTSVEVLSGGEVNVPD